MDFHAQHEGDFQQETLQLADTHVIERSGTELREEQLGAQSLQVGYDERPHVEDIIAGEAEREAQQLEE